MIIPVDRTLSDAAAQLNLQGTNSALASGGGSARGTKQQHQKLHWLLLVPDPTAR